ncbi:ABC transporter ATP-binding protein [bacterium]|nr:ABC transporter ATP-binding protein [bacterium]MBU1675257.1 ABC transporter ATP-binding protein [bacterium]
MAVLEFENIVRAYKRGVNVLDGVSFAVNEGEVVGLLGRNGAGKTTLIRIAMGMIEAQRGGVRVFGLDPRRDPLAVKRRIGYVSEEQVLPGFMTIGDVIRLHRGLFPGWDDLMAEGLCGRYGLDWNEKIKSLSKGQARQVALLCAVSHKPELLVLDEPAGGLDPAARRDFLETSIQLLNEAGSTILFSSHHMSDVERMAGRVVMLHDGKVLLDDTLDELQENFALAIVPHADGRSAALQGLPECLGVRDRIEGLHAVLRLDPDKARSAVEGRLGIRGGRYARLGLEEMFIEIAEGQS